MSGEWQWYREHGELMQGFLRMKRKQAFGKDIMRMGIYDEGNAPMILKLRVENL